MFDGVEPGALGGHWSRTGGAEAGPATLRLCSKRSSGLHFRKTPPCFPILICSQIVFSYHTGSLLLLLLTIFSRFILNLVQWLTPSRALFNAMKSLLSLDKVLMGEEDFKVAQGGGGKGIVFFQRATCIYESKRFLQPTLKNPGESLAGKISPRGESIPPSRQPPHRLARLADEVYLRVRIAASPGSKPTQALSPPVGNCPPARLPGCGHWLPPQWERGMPKPLGERASGGCPLSKPRPPSIMRSMW